ncbi:MAG: ATP-binding protein [Cellvibrionales bacterium]|nr:MAG: ATP-binding protein [Cellvibrionales bacterium]
MISVPSKRCPAAHAMPKKQLRKWIPTPGTVRRHRSLRIFGRWVENANLWQLSRHTTAKAFAIGLYCAMLPVPGQMIISVAMAIIFTANVPPSFSLIFITNPLTMPAIYYAAYKLGAWLLGAKPMDVEFEASWTWFTQSLDEIWLPLLVGSQVMGVILGIFGYLLIDSLWRNAIRRQWQARRRRRSQ